MYPKVKIYYDILYYKYNSLGPIYTTNSVFHGKKFGITSFIVNCTAKSFKIQLIFPFLGYKMKHPSYLPKLLTHY